MPKTKANPLYRSEGKIVRPFGSGWRNARALFYSRAFEVEIERDDEGWLVGSVPELPGCQTQARTEDELIRRLQEAVELALEDSDDLLSKKLFVRRRR
jgi:predicted RNase H-like HicB family nuclease